MARKHLILIHGRSIKPAEKPMRLLAKDAMREGLRRAGEEDLAKTIDKPGSSGVKYSFAYYGDINNKLQTDEGDDGHLLTAIDPETGKTVFPIEYLKKDFEYTKKVKTFNKTAYRKILSLAEDSRLLDEIADIGSFFGSLFSAGALNTMLIRHAKPDMGAYLQSHTIGSQVRERLSEHLTPALKQNHDICIIAHSMGSMVTYDQLWKCSMQSEYADIRNRKVSQFISIGSPLGEPGVRRNLLDARYPKNERYPRNIERWLNLYAEDDYISHVEKLKKAYRDMTRSTYVKKIEDKHLYNCWSYEDIKSKKRVANPHDLYGYLMHQHTGNAIADWLRN